MVGILPILPSSYSVFRFSVVATPPLFWGLASGSVLYWTVSYLDLLSCRVTRFPQRLDFWRIWSFIDGRIGGSGMDLRSKARVRIFPPLLFSFSHFSDFVFTFPSAIRHKNSVRRTRISRLSLFGMWDCDLSPVSVVRSQTHQYTKDANIYWGRLSRIFGFVTL